MKIELEDKFIFIELDVFYIKNTYAICDQIINLGLAISDLIFENDPIAVFVLFNNPEIKFKENIHKIFLKDLMINILQFRDTLSQIRALSKPIICVGKGDCQDLYWEFALACHYRLWFEKDALVGWSCIKNLNFPIGGGLENYGNKGRDFWFKNPIIASEIARHNEYIDFVGPDVLEHEWLKVWSRQLVAKTTKIDNRNIRSNIKVDFFKIYEIENKLQNSYPIDSCRTWDVCWHIVESDKIVQNQNTKEQLISYLVSKCILLSENIFPVLSKRVPENLQNEINWQVIIDITNILPPTKILNKLLSGSFKLIFWCEDSEFLANALERIYIRLERELGTRQVQIYWSNLVSWYNGGIIPNTIVAMAWKMDDLFEISFRGENFSFLRIEGNWIDAEIGWGEFLTKLDNNSANEMIEVIDPYLSQCFDGYTRVNSQSTSMPISVWVRSIFLQELVSIAIQSEKGLNGCLAMLSEMGWRQVGSHLFWNRFLKTRTQLNYKLPLIDETFVDSELFYLGSFRQVEALYNQKKIQTNKSWSKTVFHNHFCFLVLVMVYRVSYSWQISLSEANLIVAHSCGYPYIDYVPTSFILSQGLRRSVSYFNKFWPKLWRECIKEGENKFVYF